MLKQLLAGIKSFIMGGDLPTPEESRETPRVLCQYRVNVRRAGEEDYRASVVDIGATGVGLEGGPKLKHGDLIQVSYPMSREFVEENAVALEVMWSRIREHDKKVLVGARYTTNVEALRRSWVFVLLEELGLHGDSTFQKRKYARLASAMKADLRDFDTGRHLTRGKVANLSLGGALVESDEKVKSGTKLLVLMGPHIDYPTLSIHARLISSRTDENGEVWLHSLEFVDMDKKQLKNLEKLILQMLSGHSHG